MNSYSFPSAILFATILRVFGIVALIVTGYVNCVAGGVATGNGCDITLIPAEENLSNVLSVDL